MEDERLVKTVMLGMVEGDRARETPARTGLLEAAQLALDRKKWQRITSINEWVND